MIYAELDYILQNYIIYTDKHNYITNRFLDAIEAMKIKKLCLKMDGYVYLNPEKDSSIRVKCQKIKWLRKE